MACPPETFGLLLIALLPWMADGALVIGSVVGFIPNAVRQRNKRTIDPTSAGPIASGRRFVPFLVMFVVLASVQLILSMLVAPTSYTYHRDLRNKFIAVRLNWVTHLAQASRPS